MMRAITSFFLIFIVLLGAVGVSYDAHYCGGVLVDERVSFTPADLSCGMSMNTKSIDEQSDDALTFSEPCCENQHVGFEISDDYKDVQSDFFYYVPCHSFPNTERCVLSFQQEKENEFIGYSPPQLQRDIVLLKASFLI